MAYKSLNDNQRSASDVNTPSLKFDELPTNPLTENNGGRFVDGVLQSPLPIMAKEASLHDRLMPFDIQQHRQQRNSLPKILDELDLQANCSITSKEAISALQRAKSKDCRQYIAQVSCAIQAGEFYPRRLPSYCPNGNYTANAHLGCFQDEKEYRLLSGYFVHFKNSNTPELCIDICLQSGYPYAGVEYSVECFCGTETPKSSLKLSDNKCDMRCSGDSNLLCGGYYAINIYETGIKSE